MAVAWFHLTNQYPAESLVRQSGSLGWLGVEVFFVISGFVLPWALFGSGYRVDRDFWRFVSRRLMRIEPPYIASIILVIGLWHISALAPGFAGRSPDYSVSQVLSHLGYLTGLLGESWLSPVYWTLAIEFQFYLLLALTAPVWLHSRPIVPVAMSVAICALGSLTSDKLLPHHWCYFAMGIAVFRYRVGLDRPIRAAATCLLLAILLLLLGRTPWAAIAGVGAAVVLGAPSYTPNTALLRWLGSISFSLYLLHVPVGGRVVNLLGRFGDSLAMQVTRSVLALLVSVLVAYVFWRLIERPSLRWASSVPLVKRAVDTEGHPIRATQ